MPLRPRWPVEADALRLAQIAMPYEHTHTQPAQYPHGCLPVFGLPTKVASRRDRNLSMPDSLYKFRSVLLLLHMHASL